MASHTIEAAPSAYAYPLLIRHLLHGCHAAAGREIVYRDRVRLGYPAFVGRIGRLASALTRLGVGQGDTVAFMDWDSHRYLEAFFAVPMMGAVLQTVNVRLSPEQILYTLNHARPVLLVVNAEFLPLLAQIAGRLEVPARFVLIEEADASDHAVPLPQAGEYEALLAAASAEFAFPDLDESTRATTFYTTGTTGLPKGVSFSHRQIVLHTLAVSTALGCAATQGRLHRDDVYMPLTPMFHVHAWGLPYVATMLGLKQVYPGRYSPDTLLALIAREGVTFTHCVPTILHMLLDSGPGRDVDLSRCKMIIGGSALPRGLAEAALARGIDVFTGYGMSETCPILTIAHLRDAAVEQTAQISDRCRTGYAVPLVDLRIVDSRMDDAPRDGAANGEVVARAPWLTLAYTRDPVASEHLWAGGYLHTGDIGAIDARGMLTVNDRLKDVIKTGGEWVSSLALESVISLHPAVSEVAVIGIKDEKWGERPLALVVLKPGQAASAESIREHVRRNAEEGRISKFAVPDEVRFVEALARTSVGKLNKKIMREQLR